MREQLRAQACYIDGDAFPEQPGSKMKQIDCCIESQHIAMKYEIKFSPKRWINEQGSKGTAFPMGQYVKVPALSMGQHMMGWHIQWDSPSNGIVLSFVIRSVVPLLLSLTPGKIQLRSVCCLASGRQAARCPPI